MQYKFRYFIGVLAVIASMILTGCPAKTIQKAKESSAKLATYANSGVNVTRGLFQQELIGLEAKDKIADAFIILADAGIAFDLAVRNAEAAYGSDPPKTALDALFETFNAQVVAKFLNVLEKLKLVSDTGAYLAIIESLKAAVLVIAAAFGKKGQVEAQLI